MFCVNEFEICKVDVRGQTMYRYKDWLYQKCYLLKGPTWIYKRRAEERYAALARISTGKTVYLPIPPITAFMGRETYLFLPYCEYVEYHSSQKLGFKDCNYVVVGYYESNKVLLDADFTISVYGIPYSLEEYFRQQGYWCPNQAVDEVLEFIEEEGIMSHDIISVYDSIVFFKDKVLDRRPTLTCEVHPDIIFKQENLNARCVTTHQIMESMDMLHAFIVEHDKRGGVFLRCAQRALRTETSTVHNLSLIRRNWSSYGVLYPLAHWVDSNIWQGYTKKMTENQQRELLVSLVTNKQNLMDTLLHPKPVDLKPTDYTIWKQLESLQSASDLLKPIDVDKLRSLSKEAKHRISTPAEPTRKPFSEFNELLAKEEDNNLTEAELLRLAIIRITRRRKVRRDINSAKPTIPEPGTDEWFFGEPDTLEDMSNIGDEGRQQNKRKPSRKA
jgi:hypothetical protein